MTNLNFNSDIENLKERIEMINGVNKYVNNLVPKLQNALKDGFQQKDDYSFYKKDKDRLERVIEHENQTAESSPAPERLQYCYVEATQYHIALKYSVWCKRGEHGSQYHHGIIYIYNVEWQPQKHYKMRPFEPLRTDYTEKGIKEVLEKLAELEAQIRSLEDTANTIIYANYEIIKGR